MTKLSYIVYQFFNLIILIMLIRVFLSWIPNINWYKEPAYSLKKFTDFIFEPFRKIIPPVGMLDISSILAFIVVYLLQNVCVYIINFLGF